MRSGRRQVDRPLSMSGGWGRPANAMDMRSLGAQDRAELSAVRAFVNAMDMRSLGAQDPPPMSRRNSVVVHSSLVLSLAVLVGCPAKTTPGPSTTPAATPASAPAAAEAKPASQPEVMPAAAASQPMEASKAVVAACASTENCPADHVCTVDRGDCNPPPGCKPGDICPQVCYGICVDEAAAQAAVACKFDNDCRTYSNYCGSCACDAMSAEAPEPKCADKPVSCVVDPCHNKVAVCLDGVCVVDEPAK